MAITYCFYVLYLGKTDEVKRWRRATIWDMKSQKRWKCYKLVVAIMLDVYTNLKNITVIFLQL